MEVTEVSQTRPVCAAPQATPHNPSWSKPHPMRTASIAVAVVFAGCTASAEDVRPPQDQLAFPTGMAISPDEKSLFVVNANSELRYDSGSIGVIDMAQVQSVIAGWITSQTVPSNCDPDTDHIETLTCDEAQFFRPSAGVRVGNFATDLAVQDFTVNGTGNARVFVPTRGDPSIAWADFDGERLHCNSGSDNYPLCDDAHRLTSLDNDPDLLPLPNEPFAVFAHAIPAFDNNGMPAAPQRGFAMVTHLATGSITLINSPADPDQVAITDLINNVFAPDLVLGTGRGASSIAGLPLSPGAMLPGDPTVADEQIYVASSTEDRVQTFTVAQRDNAAAYMVPGNYFFLNSVGNAAGNSVDTRGLTFSPDHTRLYLVNRMPPSVQVYDTSIGPTGVPANTPLGSSDVCREASTLAVADFGPLVGNRVYVTCFQDGQVYVVDPTGQSQVEDIISVGRGPYAAVVVTGKNTPGKQFLLVSNFLEDTIAVIDLSLDSPKRNRVVLRIGRPRAP
jgi:YVTN family beta-propeller protein